MPNLTSRLITLLLACIATLSTIGLIACYLNRGWLTIQSAANLAQIFASFAVGISLLFIATQIRLQTQLFQLQTQLFQLQTQLARGANSQSFVNACSNFVLAIGCNEDLMRLYEIDGEGFERLSKDQKAQYQYLVGWWLTFFENVVYQNRIGLLDAEIYEAWLGDMKGFITRRQVRKVWPALKKNYSAQFAMTFEPLLNEPATTSVTSPDSSKTLS